MTRGQDSKRPSIQSHHHHPPYGDFLQREATRMTLVNTQLGTLRELATQHPLDVYVFLISDYLFLLSIFSILAFYFCYSRIFIQWVQKIGVLMLIDFRPHKATFTGTFPNRIHYPCHHSCDSKHFFK